MRRKSTEKTRDKNQGNNPGLHPNGVDNVESPRISESGILQGNHKQCQSDLTCNNGAVKRGLCEKHYRQQWRANNAEHNKDYEDRYYKNILKPLRQLKNQPKEKVCLRCGQLFTRTGANQKYCSKTCENNIAHKRKRQNPEFKLIHNVRSRLRKALKGNTRDKGIYILLGCSAVELKSYLESKFQPNMTWDNYGDWHMDHIVPLSSFKLENSAELKKACHYTNLQPLWAADNIRKGENLV